MSDLETILRTSDDALVHQLGAWLIHGDAPKDESARAIDLPARIMARWRAHGSGSSEIIAEIPLKTLPEGPDPLIDELQRLLNERIGTDAIGQLTIRGHGAGFSAKPGLNWTRTIGTQGATSDVIRELRDTRAQNRKLQDLLSAGFTAQGSTIAALASSVAQLGTARTVGSASADMGTSIVSSVALLVVVLPFLRRLLKRGDLVELEPLSKQLADNLGIELPTNAAPADQISEVLDQLEGSPVMRGKLAGELGKRPALAMQLIAAGGPELAALLGGPVTSPPAPEGAR